MTTVKQDLELLGRSESLLVLVVGIEAEKLREQ